MVGEQLRVIEGNERGKRLAIDGEMLIGRSAQDPDGRLGDDVEISRRHARFSRDVQGELMIEDLGSANGTFVNGERIAAPRKLQLGDEVRVGKTILQVTDSAGAAPEPEGAAELVVRAGEGPVRRIKLRDELVIGRGVSGEGRLSDDEKVSRRHARVLRDPSGRLMIEDLGSANGTFVNDERVERSRALASGDVIRIGSTTLEVAELGASMVMRPDVARPRAQEPPAAAPPRPRPRPRARRRGPRRRHHRRHRDRRPRAPRRERPPTTSRWALASRGARSRRSSARARWESSTWPRSLPSSARWRLR